MDLDALISTVKAYCARTGTSVSEFGELVANDRSLVRRIETARDCRVSTIARITAFMADNPDGPPPKAAPEPADQRGAA
jgi:hypothetical protein